MFEKNGSYVFNYSGAAIHYFAPVELKSASTDIPHKYGIATRCSRLHDMNLISIESQRLDAIEIGRAIIKAEVGNPMKRPPLAKAVASLLTLTSIGGCAGVTLYSDPELTKETGIPIYAPKPYILVARTGAKDKPVEISVVHLSDPNKVIYAKPRSGYGSANLTMALANGQMTSFGQQTDTKIPELIASLGGIITARATASKTEAEAAQIRAGIATTQQAAISAVEAGKKIVAVADDMLDKLPKLSGLTKDETLTVSSAAQALKSAGTTLSKPENAPTAQQNFETVKAQVELLTKIPAPSTAGTPRDASLQFVQAWAGELNKQYAAAQPEQEAPPAFELYEIIQAPSGVTLRMVNP